MIDKGTYYLFIHSLCGGGSQRICVTLANGLVKKNYKVKLILLEHVGIYMKEVLNEVEIINLGKKHARSSLLPIIKMLIREKPDSILVFNHQLAIQLIIARFLLRKSFRIVNRHISNLVEAKANEVSLWHKYVVHYFVKFLYRNVNTIITQSKGVIDQLVHYYKIPRNKIIHIRNPVSELVRLASLQIPERSTQNNKKNVVLYVGRLVKIKQVDFLIETFSKCLLKKKNLYLKICGEGPERENLEILAKEKGIQKNVDFLGYVENIYNVYSQSGMLVLTSRYEGFPNVLIEAITMGLPIVAFDCDYGPSEIIIEDINGYLVPQNDTETLGKRILQTLDKSWDIHKIRETGSRFYLSNIVGQYISVLNS